MFFFAALCLQVFATVQADVGFDLLFTTNLEEFEDKQLATNGEIPSWIKGTWIRNGPGQFEMGPRRFTHYFDGFSKMASFSFNNGKVNFTTKYLQTAQYKESRQMNDIAPYTTVGDVAPPYSPTDKIRSMTRGMDNTDVNVATLVDGNTTRFYALNDIWRMYEFNRTTLNTIGVVNPPTRKEFLEFDLRLSSAHPIKEHGTDSWITYNSVWNPLGQSDIFVYRVRALSDPELIASFKVDNLPLMHSYGVSKNYATFTANTCYMDMAKGIYSAPFDAIKCDLNKQSSVFVVNLKSGEVREMKSEAMLAFHHINSYELDENTIVVDSTDLRDFTVVQHFTLDTLMNKKARDSMLQTRGRIIRLTIHLDTNTVDVRSIKPVNTTLDFLSRAELPTINEQMRQQEYCYFYGFNSMSAPHQFSNFSISKNDVCGGGGDRIWFKENHYTSESQFVPRPGATSEDDGVLLSVVLDGEKKHSYIAVIDAKTMKLVASADLPVTIPLSFHGKMFD